MLEVGPRIQIPLRELHFRFVKSGGAGGQNVNKVNTQAVLRWSIEGTRSLPDDVRRRFCGKFHRRINLEGELVLSSQRFRDQGRNVADCLEKLRRMLEEVANPAKKRKATKPTHSSKEKRLKEKHHRTSIKKKRGRVDSES